MRPMPRRTQQRRVISTMPNPNSLPEPVRPMVEGGYWRIAVRPSQYIPNRVQYGDLRGILEKAQVRLRGWYFPHLSNKDAEIQRGKDYYGTWVVFTNYEYWRFYESAQLIHYHGIRENIDEMYRTKSRK